MGRASASLRGGRDHDRCGRGGRIVNIASQAAKSGFPHAQAHTASKLGLVGLVRSAAIELGGHGITIGADPAASVPAFATARLQDGRVLRAHAGAASGKSARLPRLRRMEQCDDRVFDAIATLDQADDAAASLRRTGIIG